ncbi:MAG TPA: hypothetical protein VGD49_08345 [Longimicrobiales bacterium]
MNDAIAMWKVDDVSPVPAQRPTQPPPGQLPLATPRPVPRRRIVVGTQRLYLMNFL